MDSAKPPETDVDNALIVYEALKTLTPHQATFRRHCGRIYAIATAQNMSLGDGLEDPKGKEIPKKSTTISLPETAAA